MGTNLVSLLIGLTVLLCSCNDNYMRGSLPNHLQNHEGIFIHSISDNSFSGNNPMVMLKIANDAPISQVARIHCRFSYAIGSQENSYASIKLQPMEWRRIRMTGRKSSWGIKVNCKVGR